MPEEFTLEERVGDGAAVYHHELVVHAGDGARYQVLADTRFSLDEHRACVQYGAFHRLAEFLHRFAFAYEVAHAFGEYAARALDFLELGNLAHQVQAQRLDREQNVVEVAGNAGIFFRVVGVGENHRIGGE